MRPKTYVIVSAMVLLGAFAPAFGAFAYQYTGPMEKISTSPYCQAGGYNHTFSAEQGLAFHVTGLIQVTHDTNNPTEFVKITNSTAGSKFQVHNLTLEIMRESASSQNIVMSVARKIIGPHTTHHVIPYKIADPVSALAGETTLSGIRYQAVDIWFYAFSNSTWVETQSGPSALGKSFNALTLFGVSPNAGFVEVSVLKSCSQTTSLGYSNFSKSRPTVDVYTLKYADFQQALDAEYAKADAPLTIGGVLQPTRNNTPFINNGPRRLAAAF